MKTIIAQSNSYFDQMNIGETLIIFDKTINNGNISKQDWMEAFVRLEQLPQAMVVDDGKGSGTKIHCELHKHSNDIANIYLSADGSPMESIRQPFRLFKHQLANFSSDKEDFIKEVSFLVLNRITFKIDSEEAQLVYALKKADLMPEILDIHIDQEIYLSNGIYVKVINSEDLRTKYSKLALEQLNAISGYGRTPIRDLAFGYFGKIQGQEKFLDIIIPDYSQSLELRSAENIDELDDFLIDAIEEKRGLPINELAKRAKLEGANSNREEISGDEELSHSDLQKLYDQKLSQATNNEERASIKSSFNAMVKAMNKGQSISKDEAEAEWSDLEDFEGFGEKKKQGLSLEDANFTEQKSHYAIVAKKYSDAIISTFDNEPISDAINSDYEMLESMYSDFCNKFESATNSKEKMKIVYLINVLIQKFNLRLNTRLSRLKNP